MANLFGFGENEPILKSAEENGDRLGTFAIKIKNLFSDLYDTLNSFSWTAATTSADGFMSAEDKTALDAVPSTYLPLTGGTLTGPLTLNQTLSFSSSNPVINSGGADHYLRLGNGTTSTLYANGASLYLYGATATGDASGGFNLQTYDGTSRYTLAGRPSGALTWGGVDLATTRTGTWTPILKGGSTAGDFTYDSNTEGYYTKIGKLVFFYCRIATTAYSTHPTGRVRISGLPFYSANNQTSYTIVNAFGYSGGVNSSVMKICGGVVPYNSAYVDLLAQSSDTPWQKSYATFSSSSATGYNVQFNSSNKTSTFYASGCYEAAN